MDKHSDKSRSQITVHNEEYEQNKSAVADMLVKRIMHVGYDLPRNVKADFSKLLQQHEETRNR